MRKLLRPFAAILAAAFVAIFVSGCGYNDLQRQDEQIKAAWSEVINQYQRRSDLVPNLVNTVKGYAAQEQTMLVQVAEAARDVGAIKVSSRADQRPAAFAKFEAAQGQLSVRAVASLGGVGKLSAARKPDAAFRDLTAQLEGTENRITVARNRYIKAVQRLQRDGAHVSDQSHGDAVQDGREAELHGR